LIQCKGWASTCCFIILFLGINAGVAGCCIGLALSFAGKVTANSAINSYEVKVMVIMVVPGSRVKGVFIYSFLSFFH
jgi:hypothetical protein